ncbi:MAG: hypothetical protein KUG68_11715, partial [Flavobacteriaceae bacterium]|nr:hypothetical protein [Flavobacteriaceae bacterium]
MKYTFLLLFFPSLLFSQLDSNYAPTLENPFGKLNPGAPIQVADYAPLIGICDCTSTRIKQDQTWGESQKMEWTFKYIMNGTAVQDESIKEDGSHSGSIRQYIADSSRWYVHWYSNKTPPTSLPTWEGNKKGDDIVLYKERKAPNGMDGFYRLSFKNISEDGFNWIGEWVDTSETVVFPTWKIDCIKRKKLSDKEIIEKNTTSFSKAYMELDYQSLANHYSEDGKIFPNNSDIISGRTAIKRKWMLPEGMSIKYHKVTASEIKIIDDYAYDYGYYEG